MSEVDTADPKMSGGQASQAGNGADASLNQTRDAVPMKELPSPAIDNAAPKTEAASNPTSKPPATEPVSIAAPSKEAPAPPAAVAATSTSEPAEDTIEPTTKGKEKASSSAAAAAPATLAKIGREDSIAIGPSVDSVQPIIPPAAHEGPVCNITLLLTTGARHPYRIDERYLAKRNVPVPGSTDAGKKDPFTISVYTLKELILREWRDEWDPKPASPSSIRLIHFGKLLDDKDQLKQYQFSAEAANVVHMTVKPQDITDEEEPKGGNKSSSGAGRNRDGGSGCCVIL